MFLYEKAVLKRLLSDGKIDRAEYARRLTDLIHREAGVDSFERHVDSALGVVR